MTALWIVCILVALVTILNTVLVMLLWVYTAALTTVVNSHIRDEESHWMSDFDGDADA